MQIDPVIVVGGARVFAGDCREVLKGLPDNSVDSIVTDPPYELGFMGKKWDSSGIAYDVRVWAECLRVLKPGGHLLAFGGSRTYHRLGVAIEDAGFEIRDTIAWISSKTFPKSLNVSKAIDKKLGAERQVLGTYQVTGNRPDRENFGANDRTGGKGMGFRPGDVEVTVSSTHQAKEWEGWGTGLKQVVEPVVMARKPLDGTVAENTLRWGVGGLNIDGSRIGTKENLARPFGTPSDHVGQLKTLPHGELNTPSALGRWPANVILDEVSAGFVDEQSGVSTSGAAGKNASSGFPGGGYDGDYSVPYGDTGGASRFFYVAKASKRDRNEGLGELEDQRVGSFNGNVDETPGRKIGGNPDRPNLPGKNTHPTVKPTALMRYLIKLVTPPGGTVLDPFTGSGSTGKAALLDGFQFVGIELTEEYLPIIEGRLRWATEQGDDDDTLF
jgi:site-specific DNA-methyltransferase (adenine-specific)